MADADALRLERDQARQRAMTPIKVAQKLFRDWAGANLAVLDIPLAADLVKRVEAIIKAERQSPL